VFSTNSKIRVTNNWMCLADTVYQFISCIDRGNDLQPELNKTHSTLQWREGGGRINLVSRKTVRDIRDNSGSSVHSLSGHVPYAVLQQLITEVYVI
jgi:hypothetical protein